MSLIPQTVREQVTNQIRNDLLSGRFPAGTMLREIELAARFGVSRGPVRDAFIQLSHEGYLAYQANRGVMVRHPPNPKDREFITSVRLQIETYVIQRGFDTKSKESTADVKQALERLHEACQSGEASQVAIRDIEFHQKILVACGGEDMVPTWRQLCSRMLLTYTRLGDYGQAYKEHVAIFEPFRDGNLKKTLAAVRANIK
ncbi:GntR family transcriptional regulator [Aporhodopirellula aestuarii]|uniref:GntR family transcriptional regulator n=1 Tax=Aporhodopirellula aestuarii TaxID=2950107 RepID=A0ABT0UCX9_9BACT|nr:GntR family transcriptional regulator [Aporhodopirellula aestuarii]MCM2374887.1 GntR family transcriptional regulator [Aporhodopirellula aestuarii]